MARGRVMPVVSTRTWEFSLVSGGDENSRVGSGHGLPEDLLVAVASVRSLVLSI